MVKKPCNARFDPWSGKFPHGTRPLSPRAVPTEPVLWSLQDATIETRMPRAHAMQQEKPPE